MPGFTLTKHYHQIVTNTLAKVGSVQVGLFTVTTYDNMQMHNQSVINYRAMHQALNHRTSEEKLHTTPQEKNKTSCDCQYTF